MKVGPLDSLSATVRALESIVAKSSTHEAMREQAAELGIEPDFFEQIMARLRTGERANVVDRRVSRDEISEALVRVLESESESSGVQAGLMGSWAGARQLLREQGKPLARTMLSLYEARQETSMAYRPNIPDLTAEFGAWVEQASAQQQDGNELIAHLRQAVADAKEDAWKVEIFQRLAERAGGEFLREPKESEIAELIAEGLDNEPLNRAAALVPLERQAEAARAHQHVGKALVDLYDAAA